MHDWGSRDATLPRDQQAPCSTRLPRIIHGEDDFVTVPMQGSGTFAVEAMLTTFVPHERQGAGADQRRLWPSRQAILDIAGAQDRGARDAGGHAARSRRRRAHAQAPTPAITPRLRGHCETTSGILNPIEAIAAIAAPARQAPARRRDERLRRAAARCPQGRLRRGRGVLEQMHRGRAGPRLRDLPPRRRWPRPRATPRRWCSTCTTSGSNFEKTGQYRFTPPIHVIVAFHQALDGILGRGRRRRAAAGATPRTARVLIEGMRALGFETLLPSDLQAPIIVTFRMPRRPELRVPALLRRG